MIFFLNLGGVSLELILLMVKTHFFFKLNNYFTFTSAGSSVNSNERLNVLFRLKKEFLCYNIILIKLYLLNYLSPAILSLPLSVSMHMLSSKY